MRLLILFLSTLSAFVFQAQAQRLDNEDVRGRQEYLRKEILIFADQIVVNSRFSTDINQLDTARTLMARALEVLSNTHNPRPTPPRPSPTPPSYPGEQYRYKCISRDNDGRSPYILSVENRSTYEVRRLDLVYSSMETCQQSTLDIKVRDNFTFICASRDNDGRNPYSLYFLNIDHARKINLAFSSYQDCTHSIDVSRVTRSAVALCSSRDNDGRGPWSIYTLDKDSRDLRRTEISYGSLQECERNL